MSRAQTTEATLPAGVDGAVLRPRRGLFIVLLLVWAVWAAVLLVMYFKTIAPSHRQPMPVTSTDVTR